VAFDPDTGELGVAVESKFFAVGSVVPWAKAGVGAIATQAFANTTFGPKGLELLAAGKGAEQTLRALLEADPLADRRQAGIVDAKGGVATHTGARCNAWAGGKMGARYTVQGNILTGKEVVDVMAAAFEASAGQPLADRLVKALLAGQAAGGDSRGQQSAALLVVRAKGGYAGFNDRYIDLRVDDHPHPIEELRRLLELHHVVNAYTDARFHVGRGDRERGIRLMEEATKKAVTSAGDREEEKGNAYYDLACFYSLSGMKNEALSNLEMAFRMNASLISYSLNDTDLDPLRDEPRYKSLVKDAARPPEP
jgi:uncharacterized Ntn-hydrolase superfamily protein